MDSGREAFPNDIEALKAALVAERGERIVEAARAARTEAELAVARAKASDDQALIANQQLQIEKLRRVGGASLLTMRNKELHLFN
jgi:transposase